MGVEILDNGTRVLTAPGATFGTDALLLLTEWKEFRLPEWNRIKSMMNRALILDGRNIFDAEELRGLGFEYHCIGR